MRSTIPRLGAVLVSLGLVLAACGGTSSSGSGEPSGSSGSGEKVTIKWYCCLGTGDDPIQVPVERQVVEDFNASHPNINLELQIVDYLEAFDTMSVQVAGGNAPDIVGPVGVSGSEGFHGQWLDLTDLIEANNYDLSQFSQGSVEFYKVGGEGQAGLPFAIYPSMLYYHRDAFEEAGLEEPPHAYGEPYVLDGQEVEWNMDTMWELAKRLTVDVNNNDANSPDFDPTKIEQYGYEPTFQDLRAIGSYYGAGSLVADDQTTAELPDPWHDAWVDLYEKTHTDHVIMTEALRDAAEFGNENPFQAGRAAMSLTHLWYQCCASPADADGNIIGDPDWDIAVVPSYNGVYTANFNADTFRIWKDTEHPQEAFEVLTYLLGEASQDLLGIYGGMPARIADQDAFFAGLNEKWTQGVDWQVAIDGVEYADNPNFEAWMPNYQKSFDAIQSELSVLRTKPDLDIEAEIDKFMTKLQGIFDQAEE